ncbi:MAG: coenzyme F420-0:L-glutamate ligase [Anaerolineae bacterium]|nr:coenzyme F420-0:L-glutamate ligase [Anaerolineae bacterium]
MEIRPIQTPVIQKDQNLVAVFLDTFQEPLAEGDLVCVTSKVVSLEQGRVVRLADVRPSARARRMEKLKYSKDFAAQPELAELILQEAERVFEDGFVYLTLKDHVFIANAGIDLSNAPAGYAILWPSRSWAWAENFRQSLKKRYQIERLGVIVTDSHLTPLRRGVTGLAVAYSGFEGIQSEIGRPDLFGRPLEITEKAVADDLASAAVLVMGEAGESTPFALIRAAPVVFTDRSIDPQETFINPKMDLYAGIYQDSFKALLDIPMKPFPAIGPQGQETEA